MPHDAANKPARRTVARSAGDDLQGAMRKFLDAKSFALVGASADPRKWSYHILRNILRVGYEGHLYPVNPKATEIQGVKAWPSIGSLPEVPDVALLALPAKVAAQGLEEIAQAGVRTVIVITSGFAETENFAGEEELVRIAREWNLAMVGPNSMGVYSRPAKLYAIMAPSVPDPGGISLVTQSGNVGGESMRRSHLHGTGFTMVFSVGNGAVLEWPEYLDFFAKHEETKVIALYIEGVRSGPRFLASLARATLTKPVVVLKGGGTGPGSSAARSHSAALATPEALFRGVVRQAGGQVVDTAEEMLDVAAALELAPPPKGPRVGIVTAGGGWGVLCADACARAGLEVAPLSPKTFAALDALLPPFWSRGNPVDLVAPLDSAVRLGALRAVAEAEEFDAVIALGLLFSEDPRFASLDAARTSAYATTTEECSLEMARLVRETGKPIIGVTIGGGAGVPAEVVGRVPTYPTPERAVQALERLLEYGRHLSRPKTDEAKPKAPSHKAAGILRGAPTGTTLSEKESLELLASYGIPTVGWELAGSRREALDAAARLGFPVVLKATGRGIAHKTERGLVVANLDSKARLASAWRTIHSRLRPEDKLDGLLVQSMLSSRREFAVGMVRDPVFGPCVMFGLGGIYAESLKDVSFRAAPLTTADAMEMMEEIRAVALLAPLRGEPGVDRKALATALVRLGRLAADFPQIAEIDINPMLVPGGKPVAVDALVVIG
ncbi:MAG: acetate--CoA ligase family protein [Actinomycetota bacterium]